LSRKGDCVEPAGPTFEVRVRRLSVVLSGTVAVLVSSLACLVIQQQLNAGLGVAYPLFGYGGEVVAIDLLGGVVPLLASVILFASVVLDAAMRGGPLPFRNPVLWLSMVVISLLSVTVFALASAAYGGAGIPTGWARGMVALGSAIGAGFAASLGQARTLLEGIAECYVIGALAIFLGDVLRTFAGLVAGQIVVWGGGGLSTFYSGSGPTWRWPSWSSGLCNRGSRAGFPPSFERGRLPGQLQLDRGLQGHSSGTFEVSW